MGRITRIVGREVLDSRGRPTVEAEVATAEGWGRAIAPSGASTGTAEACELRDGGERYGGLGVRKAVESIEQQIAPALQGRDCRDQAGIDQQLIALDGTAQKTKLGANALLAVSLAVAHASAAERSLDLHEHLGELWRDHYGGGLPTLPLPMTNMISGGLHAGGNLDFQDILIYPWSAPDYPTGLEWIVRVYQALGKRLRAGGWEGYLVGDEGGFGPRLRDNREAVQIVVAAIEDAGLRPQDDVRLALDVAATHFYQQDGTYRLATEQTDLTSAQMIDRLESWCDAFPIGSIEDGLAEDDWEGWRQMQQRLGDRVALVGDDLLTTNPVRVQRAMDQQAASALLVKFNQIGTLSETLQTMQLARSAGWSLVVSARSGETEDTTIADLAVATAADFIKIGSITRSERLAKYNRLLRICDEIPHLSQAWKSA